MLTPCILIDCTDASEEAARSVFWVKEFPLPRNFKISMAQTLVVRMAIKRCDAVYTGRISPRFHRNALAQVHLMIVSATVYFSIMKMEVVLSYEMSANY
jgi:hypothetical protein